MTVRVLLLFYASLLRAACAPSPFAGQPPALPPALYALETVALTHDGAECYQTVTSQQMDGYAVAVVSPCPR